MPLPFFHVDISAMGRLNLQRPLGRIAVMLGILKTSLHQTLALVPTGII